MTINKDFKKLSCIHNMEEEYRLKFDKLAEHYGELLNQGSPTNTSVYTLHDFDHHCFNIYKIISKCILNENNAYTNGLNEEELYFLNVSVLFHDISMTRNGWVREKHSLESAEFIEKEYRNTSSILRTKSGLSQNDIDAIKLIVKAHSDIKDDLVPKECRGLKDPELKHNLPSRVGKIRGKLLAGILRLADELDITNDRLGNNDFEEQLNPEVEADKESKKHWKKLHMFKEITINEDKASQLLITLHDENIRRFIDAGDSGIIEELMEVKRKIENELNFIGEKIFNKKDVITFITIKDIAIISSLEEVNQQLQKYNNKASLIADPSNLTESNEVDSVTSIKAISELEESNSKYFPQVIDSTFEMEISNWIQKRHLTMFGHYLINENYCSRDWINIRDIIETEEFCRPVVELIADHIKSNQSVSADDLIVGLDIEGTLLASKVAFLLQMPFSYVIPAQNIGVTGKHDKDFNKEEYKKYIFITDVISTGTTLNSVINYYDFKNESVKAVYAILCRMPHSPSVKCINKYISKTFSLNNKHPIELASKQDCRFSLIQECHALNKKS